VPGSLARTFAYGRSTVFRSPMRHPETTRGSLIFEMQPLPEISGFYTWGRITSVTDPPRPDTYYALSKVYVEGLGSMYADRYGLEVHQPPHRRFLAGAPEPAQLAEPGRHGATRHLRTHCAFHPCHHLLRRVMNTRRFYTDDGWVELGYDPQDDAEHFAHRWPNAAPPALRGMTFTDPHYVGD
jgi:uronate dehydrogenase